MTRKFRNLIGRMLYANGREAYRCAAPYLGERLQAKAYRVVEQAEATYTRLKGA